MTKRIYLWSFAAVAAISALLSYHANSDWDYPEDAGPAIDALIHGRIHEFLAARPLMGPVSLIVRAPFAALSLLTQGPGYHFYNDAYRFGIFPCLLIAGVLGIHLADVAGKRGARPLAQLAIGLLFLVNTPTLKALVAGHPEEILGGALCVAAMLAGLRGRSALAVVLLMLALGTKQWAVVAIVPVALTLSRTAMVRSAKIVLGLGMVLLVPFLAVDPGSLWTMTRHLADIRQAGALPADIWWFFRTPTGVPDWVGLVSHPLLIATCAGVALLLARRVREHPLERALPLLALVLLLRCILDPLDNAYYHVPFFLALVAADALVGSVAATLVAAALFYVTTELATTTESVNVIYLTWALPFVAYLVGRTYGIDWAALLRSRGALGPDVALPAHLSSSGARRRTAR